MLRFCVTHVACTHMTHMSSMCFRRVGNHAPSHTGSIGKRECVH